VARVAIDGTRLRDVSPETMTPAQRGILEQLAEDERLELVLYLTARLSMHKYGLE